MAKSEYQLGLDRGLFDFKSDTPFTVVAKILDKHPQAFWNGWLEGFCMNGYGSGDADELTFDCSNAISYKAGSSYGAADLIMALPIITATS
jgi:hypothetical protein